MKRLLQSAAIAGVLFSCGTEESADLGDTSSFYRYYGSEYSHLPQQVLETSDGYILLNNIQVPTQIQGVFKYKIKLIKTDKSGNVQWDAAFPSFTEANQDISLYGYSMIATETGYVIVGEEINMATPTSPGPGNLAMLTVDLTGAQVGTYTSISAQSQGLAAAVSLTGRGISTVDNTFIVMGGVAGNTPASTNMFYASLSSTFVVNWIRFVGDGVTSLCNSVFVTPAGKIIWGGSSDDMRLFEYQQNDQTSVVTKRDAPNNANEEAFALCKVSGGLAGYAMIGTTPGTTSDIYVVKFNQAGTQEVAFTKQLDFNGGNDVGKAVSSTGEGGLILASNAASGNDKGYGSTDILLTRLTSSGDELWSLNYGSSQEDEAASVIQTKDGGFLILGSTEFGDNFRKVTLIKTNPNGELK